MLEGACHHGPVGHVTVDTDQPDSYTTVIRRHHLFPTDVVGTSHLARTLHRASCRDRLVDNLTELRAIHRHAGTVVDDDILLGSQLRKMLRQDRVDVFGLRPGNPEIHCRQAPLQWRKRHGADHDDQRPAHQDRPPPPAHPSAPPRQHRARG